MLRLAIMGLLAKWKHFTLPIIILSLSFFFIIYETTMFGVALARTYSIVKVLPGVDLWVMNENTNSINSVNDLSELDLVKVKSIPGVQAVSPILPLKKEFLSIKKKKLETTCLGVDINYPFVFPSNFIKGKPQNLSYQSGILVDNVSSKKLSLKLGSKLKAAKDNSTVVGIFSAPKTIAQQPLVITSMDWAKNIANSADLKFPFIIVKGKNQAQLGKLKAQIEKTTQLKAFDKSEFSKLILTTIMKETGLPHAFGAVVICGLMLAIGIILATFYSVIEHANFELTLYSTLGAPKITLLGISILYASATALAGIILALVYNTILLAALPTGSFAFAPNIEIVFLISLISFVSITLIALLRANSITNLGAELS